MPKLQIQARGTWGKSNKTCPGEKVEKRNLCLPAQYKEIKSQGKKWIDVSAQHKITIFTEAAPAAKFEKV